MADEAPTVHGLAGRYATALFELAYEQRTIDAVTGDLDRFNAMLADSADLSRLVRSPVFTAEEQSRALAQVLHKAGIGGLAANFLKLVAAKRRLFAIGDIIKAYRTLVAHHKGEVTAQVTLAEQPSEQHLSAIKTALKGVTGRDVQIDMKIDPAIIGGLVVRLGSRMVDTSLRSKLNAIKHAMKEAG